MDAKEKTLTTFSTRVRQLILQFRELKAENNELYAMVDERDKKIKELESQVAQKQTEYESLKTAKMLEITDGDLDGAKKRVARLVREVNKCLTLLSESTQWLRPTRQNNISHSTPTTPTFRSIASPKRRCCTATRRRKSRKR